MKDIKNILFFLFAVLITLNSCEEIDDPLEGATEVGSLLILLLRFQQLKVHQAPQ